MLFNMLSYFKCLHAVEETGMSYAREKQTHLQFHKAALSQKKLSENTLQGGGMPNSALLSLLSAGQETGASSSPDLEERILARLPVLPPRRQEQIPQAEQEADRLSASVTSGTPEGVKATMGRRMGADFSGVRFHTDDAAAARAGAMGARAFTSGAAIYFGPGGFDPGVAAHELVHTAQQGMVNSSVMTASAPAGGIQMRPWDNNEEERDEKKGGVGNWLYDRTIGRLSRWNREAIDELHDVKTVREDGTRLWDELSKSQKRRWKIRNPLAYSGIKKARRSARRPRRG